MTNADAALDSGAMPGGAGSRFALAGPGAPSVRLDAFRRAQQHSRVVKALKLVLPLLALGFVALFAFFVYRASASAPLIETDSAAVAAGQLIMDDPRLKGFTREGRPYSVIAERASQELSDESTVQLSALKAQLPVNEKGWLMVQSPVGIYDRDANTLRLDGDITVTSSDKTTITMRSALVDLDAGTVKATDSVDVTRREGAITAENAEYSRDGKVLTFKDKVRMTLDPGKQNTRPGPAAGAPDGDGHAKP